MSAFDEIIYGAKKCFDAASVKTNEFFEASKVQIEKSQLNCKLKEEYINLGKIYYDMSETGIDKTEKMKSIIAKIHGYLEDIKLANENFVKEKFKICENCGEQNSINYEYCSKCGTKL